MTAHVSHTLLPRLRHEPASTRVRATIGQEVIVDSTQAVRVWEPRRMLPAYAVPREHVHGELLPTPVSAAPARSLGVQLADGEAVLEPSVPFAVHTAGGESLSLRAAGQIRHGVAFAPADPELHGLVLLDSAGFDVWHEGDVAVLGRARDPFHRLDILSCPRTVRVELDGVLLAESARAQLVFEDVIVPVRAYLPPEDVRVALRPSPTRARSPCKGEATYWSVDLGGRTVRDVAWSHEAPCAAAGRIAGLISFFNERVDVSLAGGPGE